MQQITNRKGLYAAEVTRVLRYKVYLKTWEIRETALYLELQWA